MVGLAEDALVDLRPDLARELVAAAGRRGAAAEVYLTGEQRLSVEVSGQEVENLKQAVEIGLGLRVILGERLGFAYSTDLSPAALEETLERALAGAKRAARDPFNRLPAPPSAPYARLDLGAPDLARRPLAAKIELARRLEQAARGYDPRVTVMERAAYQEASYGVFLVNSEGLEGGYQGSYCGLAASLVAEEDGDAQTGFWLQYELYPDRLDPEGVGRQAAARALGQLHARELGTQRVAVALEPWVATGFLGLVAPALSAKAVQRGRSFFAGRQGEQVAAAAVTVVDHGARPNGLMSAPFDGEGTPTGAVALIEGGRLQGFLHSCYTAAKAKTNSTGNARRSSFRSVPEVGSSNLYLQPGHLSREELLRRAGRCLLVTEVMGLHTANPVSGDFSLGASGLWIEEGAAPRPVRGVVLGGNLRRLLLSVEAVADDLTFFGGRGSPTLLVGGLTVSGS